MSRRRLNRQRLVAIANLFSSPHDGERAAAAAAFLRALEAAGSSPEDLLLGEAGPASKPARKAKAKPQGAADHASEAAHTDAADHKPYAEALLARAGDVLSPFEKSFLRGVVGYTYLSEKQKLVLDQIATKAAEFGRGT